MRIQFGSGSLAGALLALTVSAAGATAIAIDTTNPVNGITDLYSATFDGPRSPCTGSSPSYCTFFQGDWPTDRAMSFAPTPTGVANGVPAGLPLPPVAGSFLDIQLSADNTIAQIVSDSTILLASSTLTVNSPNGTLTTSVSGAGFLIKPSGTAAVNSSGQVEFLVDNAPGLAANFSVLSSVTSGCVGSLCTLVPILSLDMIRYRLFVDFDPTFTSFTGTFIGQGTGGTTVFANLNSAPVPAPASVWLLATGLATLRLTHRRTGRK